MGCFDVSCGISGITIKHGDDALLLFLIPFTQYPESARERKVEIEQGVQQVFNEGPLGMYMPLCLPIRGKYNDYGSLEDIVEDETLEALEKFFGAKFGQIIEAVRRGKYGTMHDEEILGIYGNGLKVSRYNDSKVTPEWLETAGFTEKDGKYYHPDVTNIIKFGKTGKIEKTEEQKCYVEFKVPFKGSNEKGIMPHIIWWENDKWNEIWQRDQRDFCNTFMEKSRPMGWFADDYGVVLGIKKDMLKKAMLLRRVSGMFIDGKVYDAMTEGGVKTNIYYSTYAGGVRTSYMNKFLMDKIGLKFERIVDDKTKEEPKDRYAEIELLYSHKDAPGYLFGVTERRSMATDMYKVEKDKLVQVKTYNGKKSYHPFSPDGLAVMFEGETGNKLDLSGLDGVTPFDITLLRIQDYVSKRDSDMKAREEMKKKIEAETTEEGKEKVRELLRDLFRLEDRSESRDRAGEALGDLNFPFVWEFYEDNLRKPSKKFKRACFMFKNMMISLWGINRPLMPSTHFSQHGDYENQLAFNRIVSDVVKEKILGGYSKEFTNKEDMFSMIKLLFGDEYYEKPEKRQSRNKKEETVYMHNGEEVAVWRAADEYGYLITKKGL